jgi:hypothetical protein
MQRARPDSGERGKIRGEPLIGFRSCLCQHRLVPSTMSNLNLTQKWLSKEVARYPHKDIVYADVDATLIAYPTLRPKTDIYSEPIGVGL